jgi:hypothetical protein
MSYPDYLKVEQERAARNGDATIGGPCEAGQPVPANGLLEPAPRLITMPTGGSSSQLSTNDDLVNPPAASDLIDPARLRLSQNFAESIGVKKALLTVPVRRPDRQWFVRVHPDPAYRLEVAILELKEDGENYLVEPTLCPELPGEIVPKILFTSITRQGVVFLWPARLPSGNGRGDEWSRSSLEAAEMATRHWIRVASNKNLGAYEVFQATANLPEPEWPNVSFKKLLELAFRDRFIKTMDHPAIKTLRGEI